MKRQRILVVEDEFLVAMEIAFLLEKAGFGDIDQAHNEARAFQRICDEAWDGVVVDANLNGRSIDRVAAALCERSIPFIVVTGYSRDTLPASVADVPVLEKPFQGRRLLDALDSVLQRRDV